MFLKTQTTSSRGWIPDLEALLPCQDAQKGGPRDFGSENCKGNKNMGFLGHSRRSRGEERGSWIVTS